MPEESSFASVENPPRKPFRCPHPSVEDPTQPCPFSSNQLAGLNRHVNQTHLGKTRRKGGRRKTKGRVYQRRASANGLRPSPPPVVQVVQFCPACGIDNEIIAQAMLLARRKQHEHGV